MKLLDLLLFKRPQPGGIQPMHAARAVSKPKAGGIGAAVVGVILAAIYVVEGGYADHPNDRGGKTKYGVTETVAREFGYRGHMRDFPKHCDAGKPICADLIYTKRYIEQPGYMPLATIEPAVMEELVDSAVLHGPARGSGWFQESLNELSGSRLVVDRQVGPATIAAYQAYQQRAGKVTACTRMLDRLDGKQERFFRDIVARRPSQKVFLKGWLRARIGNVDRAKCRSYL